MKGEAMLVVKRKVQKKKNGITFWLLLAVILLLFLWVSTSFAKLATSLNGKVAVGIATPVMEIITQQSMVITAKEPKNSCYFEVRNYNEKNEMNKAEMEYYIEILGLEDKEISFTLYEGEEIVPMEEKFISEKRKLGIHQKEEHVYRLEIVYQKGEEKLSNLNQEVEIKVHSIQKLEKKS